MDDPRFDILFEGELLPGFTPETVAENIGKLFKATPDTVRKLMGGGAHALKRGADRETALKYQAAMHKAGAKAVLREVSAAVEAVAPPAPAPASAQIGLAPQGGDILADHEKRVVEAVMIDTAHIKLVSTFMAPPEPERAAPPPAPDTKHLSMAAAGSDLLADRVVAEPPPPPDTSAISLAEPGARMADEAPPLAFELPDLSAISLAPPGSPLDELKPEQPLLDPDTSALKLEPL